MRQNELIFSEFLTESNERGETMTAYGQPTGNIWGRFLHLSHAISRWPLTSRSASKQKVSEPCPLIEAIRDPLTHHMHAALDDGIERPEGRKTCR
jgi:hypothetical protein